MSFLLYRLYDVLGLGAPEDESFLKIDDDLEIYFNESESGLEMCCPFMSLPDDMMMLQYCLRMNYASPIIIGTDEDNTTLLALNRLSQMSTDNELISGLELLITGVRQILSQGSVMRF